VQDSIINFKIKMGNLTVNWSKEEFKAYVLLYAAMSNYIETEEEKEFILSRIDQSIYDRIHKEIDVDNDFTAIQKIKKSYDSLGYSGADLEVLLKELKDLLDSDGSFDQMEMNLLMWLNKILRD